MAFPLEQWYYEIPLVTRSFITLSAVVTLATQIRLVRWFHLYYTFDYTFRQGQYWRVLTNFFYFGPLSLDWFFHMYFMIRYSRMLEEGAFRNRPADYVWMLVFSGAMLLLLAPLTESLFLGSTLAYVLVYVWCRREPRMELGFLGLFVFRAPYLPWVLLGFSALLGGGFPTGHLVGIAVGHLYYFFEYVWPREGGRRWLATPSLVQRVFSAQVGDEHGDNAELRAPLAGETAQDDRSSSGGSDGEDSDDADYAHVVGDTFPHASQRHAGAEDEYDDEREWTAVPRPHSD
ncbi:Der1-like family-domain-containing protein [Thamnocephalis sphaerospora]|uniref:Derlin n=1 Tax=Thamnocephalis sphaerospora TaxID=78915 RepID=A0A4P9XWH5_9FUNG|nr:Der1-like family-domain-containing protein [Thamnocephalis sphaerospora]|eukprot:RKP09780.1 Der1-like family-domain-containing protein [Thamnocephalis sphaerospora]